jgi:hypothetical protein
LCYSQKDRFEYGAKALVIQRTPQIDGAGKVSDHIGAAEELGDRKRPSGAWPFALVWR